MAGPGCITEQNRGAAGFHVKGGGEMEVREGCTASRNTGWGLQAEGASSVLRLGPGYGTAAATAAITAATASGPGPGSGRDVQGHMGPGLQNNTQHRKEPLGSVAAGTAGTAAGGAAPPTRPTTRLPSNPDAESPGSAGDVAPGAPSEAPRHAAAQQRKCFPPAAIDGSDRPAKRMSPGLEAAAVPGGSVPGLAEEVGPGGPPPEPGLLPRNLMAAVELGPSPRPGLPVMPMVADAPQATAATEADMQPAAVAAAAGMQPAAMAAEADMQPAAAVTEAGMHPAAVAAEADVQPAVVVKAEANRHPTLVPPLPDASEASRAMLVTAAPQVAAVNDPLPMAPGGGASAAPAAPALPTTQAAPAGGAVNAPVALAAVVATTSHLQQASPDQGTNVTFVSTWAQLEEALARLTAAGEATGAAPVPWVIDLQGKLLEPPPPPSDPRGRGTSRRCIITTRGLVLRNGELRLPAGWQLVVSAPEVQLRQLRVSGPGCEFEGKKDTEVLLVVTGKHNSVQLEECHVRVQPLSTAADTVGRTGETHGAVHPAPPHRIGVVVAGGASAHLEDCTIVNASFTGLMSRGKGSRVTATRCRVHGCQMSGFAAVTGGRMGPLVSCGAVDNGRYGFVAEDPGSSLEVGPGCLARHNGTGYIAAYGGVVDIAAACRAVNNRRFGFLAFKAGSKLVAGEGCSAMGGRAGFVAEDGGELTAGRRCIARKQADYGFYAKGVGSQLHAGEACRVDGGQGVEEDGFAAVNGGFLEAAAGCSAADCGHAGFVASHLRSRLVAGPGCVAERSGGDTRGRLGFLAELAGVLEAREGCIARRIKGEGFRADGATLLLGPNCLAEDNGSAGFLVTGGGRLEAGLGCRGVRNEGEGFCAMGGHLRLGEGCVAENNKLDGFTACQDAGEEDSEASGEDDSEDASEDTVEDDSEDTVEDDSEDDSEASGTGGRGCSPGVLDASEGKCIARANGGSGFCCEDTGCVLTVGPGCIAEQNRGAAGFHVKGGGEMEVREGCTASRNTGWGLLAEGANSVLRLGPGYGEAGALGGNAEGTCIVRDGAVLIDG
ncbi:hypothetical protein PLESTF_000489700 [Pleodorina starrii]|nr:hypothetical protein PLESTF_000489700 [Pleodorina starrii]